MQVDASNSVSDFPSAPPSVEEFPISDYRFSSFANSPLLLGCDNDRVHTESFDPFNPLALNQDFENLGGWADQPPIIEPIPNIDVRAIAIPQSNPRASSSSISSSSSSSSWVEPPQINEPLLEVEIPRGITIPQRVPRRSPSSATSTSSSSGLGWVQYQVNSSTRRLVPSGAGPNGGRRQRGRTRGLTPDQRKNAALMRVVKACSNCRKRKERVCKPETSCINSRDLRLF